MKNLVFNLRTAKAQAEGCAKVTKSSRMAKILTTLTLLLTLGVGQMWGKTNCSLTSSGDVNRAMPNYEAGYDMGTIYVWFSINGGSYSSKGSTSSNIGTNRAIDASNITSGLKFNKFSVPVYCHNQWHGDACNNNGARIVNSSLVMSWKVSNPSGTQVSSGNFEATTSPSMSWRGNGATATWTSNTSEKNLLSNVSASTSAAQTYTIDFWYKFKCHMYNKDGNDWGSDVNVWYPGGEDHFKYQFTIPKTTLTVNHSGDDGSATVSSGITSAITYNTNYSLSASNVTGYDFVNWTTSNSHITISSATSRTEATVKFTSFSNATVTANYTPHTYTITYENMTGATNHASNPSNYNIESSTITLYAPKKTGYIFNGWYSDSGLTTPVTSIANGSTGNKTLYAKWTAITISEVSASPSSGSTGVQTMTVSFKTNVPRNSGYYYRIAEFGGANAGTTGGGFHSNGNLISSGDAFTLITSGSFSTINFTSTGVYTSAIEIYTVDPITVQKRVTFTYGAGDYYTVSFDLQGHGSSISSQSILSGGKATAPSPAPTATGYTFGGWYKEPACTNAWNFSTETVTSDKILYAKWTAKNTTVTLDRQGGTTGSTSVTATYDAAMPSTTMPGKTGYSFLGYYGSTGGSGTKYYNTDGSSAHVWDVDASTRTIYANWSENMTTVTVNVSPSGAGTLTVGGSSFTPGNTTTAGVTTSRTVVATAKSGYGFDYWTTGGNATGSATTNTYTLNGNGSGSTGTLTANFYTKSNSGWYMEGADFGGWSKPTTYQFDRAYRDIANTYYMPVTLTASHYWKVHNGTNAYNTNSSTSSDQQVTKGTVYSLSTNETKSSYVSSTMSDVWVVINTGTNKKLWVQDPAIYYTITLANGSSGNTNNGAAGTEGTITLTTNDLGNLQTKQYASGERVNISVSAKTGYYVDDITIGATSVVTDVNKSSYSGYTTMPSGNTTLTVTYKPIYSVTFGVGTGMSSYGSVSNNLSISSGTKVLTGTSITFTATPNLGYKFVGWYSDAACTASVSTDNPYTVNVTSATTLYAKFELKDIKINSDINGSWPTPWTQTIMTHSSGSPAIYTYSATFLARATEDASAPYNSGYHFNFVDSNNELLYDYNGVQAPTSSGSSIDGVRKTDDGNSTIQFGLTRKSNVTITLTLKSIDDATKPTLNIAADPIYTITHGDPTHGSYTIKVGSASAVGTSTESVATTTITLAATPATGYHFDHWTVTKAGGGTVTVTSNQFAMPSDDVTVAATFLPTSYDVTLKANGGSGADKVVSATYDAAMPSILKGGGTLTAHSRTGYNFAGYYDDASTGTQYYTNVLGSARAWDKASATNLFAHWSAKTYTITLTQSGETGYGSSGTASVTATYDAALPSIASLPTAAEGYAFMGYYTGHNGTGTQYYGPTGNKLVATYTTAGGIELFAYFKKAEITNLTFDAAVVAPSTPVGVTPTVAPTPTGTNSICWKLLYNNGNLYDPQPTFSPANPGGVGNKVTFKAPPTSGMYLVAAVLRTGNECDGGTKLDSITASFQVAGNHTVTVQYKCGDVTIKASTTTTGRPLNWSDEITPPEIFGYTFSKWKAGDGVTMTIDGGETTIETGGETTGKATTHAVQIKANYDGKLIAIYTKKSIIYFKNTLGWDKVYVNIMNNQYWDVYNGSGNSNNYYARNQEMSLVDGTDDIYYLEYSGSTSVYMSFTSMSQTNATNFWATNANNLRVVYPTHPFDYQGEQTSYGFNAGTPMFVPTAGQTPVDKNINSTGKASYYNKGHWRKYDPIQGETGYTLKVYNKTEDDGRTELKSIKFVESDVPGQLFKAVANLEAAEGYGIKFERDNSMLYTNTTGHLHRTGDVVVAEKGDANYKAIWIRATAAGDYTFAITINGDGKLCIQAEFPVVKNDYRVIYTDNDTWTKAHTARSWTHSSRIINAVANAVDTISFFVSKGHSPEFKIQKVNAINETTGAITWTDVTSWTSCNDVAASGVYNFIFTQNGSKEISFTKKEAYTGNYYIRTNCAGSTKWDNYRDNSDHLMTYSEYSITHGGYSHYYCHWVTIADAARKNVKFCIANDYSPCISDTLTRETASGEWANIGSFIESNGDLKRNANVRFMWNQSTNKISRAYLDPAKGDDNFLVLASADSKIANESGVVKSSVVFSDNENWIYEANVKAKANAQIKLVATWGDAPTTIVQYFKGTDKSTETLITGGLEDTKWYDIRLIYDYKTNRLIAALLPSGNIEDPKPINADVMFIREHQGDISQVTFTDDGALTDIKIAYGVMRFSKWTLNNKDKSTHLPLDDPKSYYERALYFISFPFEVKLSEVFGFGTYAQDWIIEYYDGAERARTGWWEGQPGFWRYVWDRKNFVLEPNKGYLLELELGNFNEESGFWNNDNERLELFFPSSGNLGSITNTTVNCSIPEHACTINRAATEGLPDTGDPRTSYNRTIFDSHWNVMPVPTYVNATPNEWNNTTWTAKIGPKFLYTWNMDDNTLTATSGAGYKYHAMHAYMVQYGGNVQWVTSGTGPASIVARNTYAEEPKEVEFRLEIQQNEKMIDQTFIALSNDETVSADFQFGEDMSKDFNARNANIFTKIGTTFAAGNTMPMTDQKTIVPVGVVVKKTGDYTFSIPDGTNGIGITLIDEETGIRTSLSALDYTVELAAGDYTERFWLEISPVQQTPTDIEAVSGQPSEVRKVLIDGILYIVKDGKMYDATGKRVE